MFWVPVDKRLTNLQTACTQTKILPNIDFPSSNSLYKQILSQSLVLCIVSGFALYFFLADIPSQTAFDDMINQW